MLSIIIVSFNTCEITLKCIRSVYQYLKGRVDFEIICFDNDSSDNSAASIESQFPDVILIKNNENIGFGRANNKCFSIAKGEFCLLLNSDAFLVDESLIGMLEFLQSHDSVAVVGGKLTYPNGGLQVSYGKFPSFVYNNWYVRQIEKYLRRVVPLTSPRQVDYVNGAYFLVKKKILDKVGYFDERFWMYYEEIDLCRRVKSKGYSIYYYPISAVVHLENRTSSENQKNLRRKYRSIYYEKHYGSFIAKFISLFNIR